MIEALAPAVLAAGFRVRGWAGFQRLTGRGATTARIVAWAIPCGLVAWGLHGHWYAGAAMAVAAWAGSLLGWWRSLDLGRHEGEWARDFALHTARGLLWTAPMALAAWLSGGLPWPLLAAGLLCGLAYEAGWRLAPRRATEIGEVAFGAIVGAALALTFP
jgi:hypothetical protein